MRQEVQRMIQTGEVSISKDPFVTAFNRKATLKNLIWKPEERLIILQTMVSFEGTDGVEVPQRLKDKKEVSLETINIPSEEGEVTEYDMLIGALSMPVIAFDIIYDTIMARDAQGRFNK